MKRFLCLASLALLAVVLPALAGPPCRTRSRATAC